MNILIFGCGSIGTHHAHAARSLGFNVFITDIKKNQIDYMKEKLFPSRYGKWDNKIVCLKYENVFSNKKVFDLIIIGTSPLFHLDVLKKSFKKLKYKKISIEKPLSVYWQKIDFLKKNNKNLFCGFNHSISPSILHVFEMIKKKKIGKIHYIKINWKEDFKLVLKAHPWIKSIKDSYLSDIKRGGGVLHEYSHALHLGLCFRNILFPKKNTKMSEKILFKKVSDYKYDSEAIIELKYKNIVIEINIDSTTNPPKKDLTIFGAEGKIYWKRNMKKSQENISLSKGRKILKNNFLISRPLDFINQLKILLKKNNSSIKNITTINSAIEVMEVIKSIFKKKYV